MAIIVANDNEFTVPVAAYGTLQTAGNVRLNDTQDGSAPVPSPAFMYVFDTSGVPSEGSHPNYGFLPSGNGVINYGSAVPDGVYEIPYEIVPGDSGSPGVVSPGSSPTAVAIIIVGDGGEGGEGGEGDSCPGIAYFSRALPYCGSSSGPAG